MNPAVLAGIVLLTTSAGLFGVAGHFFQVYLDARFANLERPSDGCLECSGGYVVTAERLMNSFSFLGALFLGAGGSVLTYGLYLRLKQMKATA